MRPTRDELALAAARFSDVAAHYLRIGFAERHRDGFTLTRRGLMAFACARLPSTPGGWYYPRSWGGSNPMFWLRDAGLIRKSGPLFADPYVLTRKGERLAKQTGAFERASRERAVPAPPRSGTRLVANTKRAAA